MAPVTTEISTVTESTDTSSFKIIEKDYIIRSDQHHNSVTKDRDGNMRKMLRALVSSEIDKDSKAIMILRSQEVYLKIRTKDMEKMVACWGNIGMA